MHQTRSPQIVKAHMSAVEFDSDPRLAGNETGGWGVSQPLAFVNCMSHIVLAGTVNWKRSRGFAVLMSFPWTQVIVWIPEEPLLSPTFTDPSVRAKLFISGAMWSCPTTASSPVFGSIGSEGNRWSIISTAPFKQKWSVVHLYLDVTGCSTCIMLYSKLLYAFEYRIFSYTVFIRDSDLKKWKKN